MGLIEIEIAEDKAAELVKFLLSAAPLIPLPTLAALGPDRLISGWSWDWNSLSFQGVSMGFLERRRE